MSVLIVSPEDWQAHNVSKHHYARTLASSGRDVLFLNPPQDRSGKLIEVTEVEPRIFSINAGHLARGLRFFPGSIRRKIEGRFLNRLEDLCGQEIDTIWLFENSRFFDLKEQTTRLRIYHQVDLNQRFNPHTAANTSDIIFCTSELIASSLRQLTATPVFVIDHGVTSSNFSFSETEALGPGINAVYAGNLNRDWIDVEILKEAVSTLPNVRFTFVGNYNSSAPLYRNLSGYQNVCWLGQVAYDRIPGILAASDVLLLAYRSDFRQDASNPHKLMEYLASGKTVVATWTEHYKFNLNLLEMVNNASEFVPRLSKVVENLDHYNSGQLSKLRRSFAGSNLYERQLEKVFKLLNERNLSIPQCSERIT